MIVRANITSDNKNSSPLYKTLFKIKPTSNHHFLPAEASLISCHTDANIPFDWWYTSNFLKAIDSSFCCWFS